MKKYKIIALVGEAGSGKDSMLHYIQKISHGLLHEIISYTTRPKRENEVDGINYNFVHPIEFLDMVSNDKMLEFTKFNDWFYGTAIQSLSIDKINIGVFNPAGIYALNKRDDIDLQIYHIKTSPKQRLLRQLNREENPNVDEIIRRWETDKKDFSTTPFTAIEIKNELPDDLRQGALAILGNLN